MIILLYRFLVRLLVTSIIRTLKRPLITLKIKEGDINEELKKAIIASQPKEKYLERKSQLLLQEISEYSNFL